MTFVISDIECPMSLDVFNISTLYNRNSLKKSLGTLKLGCIVLIRDSSSPAGFLSGSFPSLDLSPSLGPFYFVGFFHFFVASHPFGLLFEAGW